MNLTRDYVFTNTNASLDRLGVDYLDLLVLNRPFCDSKVSAAMSCLRTYLHYLRRSTRVFVCTDVHESAMQRLIHLKRSCDIRNCSSR